MIQTTVGDVLDEKKDIGNLVGYFIYLYRDGETIFYIGRSFDPCNRLYEHMGQGRSAQSRLGRLIERHLPSSLEWTLEIYTLADCLPFIHESYVPRYQAELDNEQTFIQHLMENQSDLERKAIAAFPWFEIDYRETFFNYLYPKIAHIAEEALIAHYHPCLNVLNNVHATPLPEKYRGHVTITPQDLKRGKVE